jgi:hypothetical protein
MQALGRNMLLIVFANDLKLSEHSGVYPSFIEVSIPHSTYPAMQGNQVANYMQPGIHRQECLS